MLTSLSFSPRGFIMTKLLFCRNCPHTLMPRGMPSPSIVSEFFTFIRDTPIFASYFPIYWVVLFVCLIKKGTLFVPCTKCVFLSTILDPFAPSTATEKFPSKFFRSSCKLKWFFYELPASKDESGRKHLIAVDGFPGKCVCCVLDYS